MQRHQCAPRPNWRQEVERVGLNYHTIDSLPYWTENACWEFTLDEIDRLDDAATTLHKMALQAVEAVVEDRLLPLFGITGLAAELVTESWRRDDSYLYGRFDFAWTGDGEPKMLEYNADTPTSLFESAIVQHHWREAVFPDADQFNSLDEALTDRFAQMLHGLPSADPRRTLHLSCVMPHAEDEGNLRYIEACAQDAGFKTSLIAVSDIGWDKDRHQFVDMQEQPMRRLFKLYPWEWLAQEEFAAHIAAAGMSFIEPAWKMVLSNKALLAQMWEMFPHHPNLLPASFDRSAVAPLAPQGLVRKALLGREGENVTIYDPDGSTVAASGGHYGSEGYVWQARAPLAAAGRGHAVLGVWMVGAKACGLCIREDDGLITKDSSRFVPHFFR
ncbi:glutathionylspermidine synthase family protein [Insolitispirillum peregrinum]|uniref:Glutathionylspermidine synthase n=1 Tax=Insolitispirillum peregrinum TaxID=80876 RepID=A0A1N7MUE8_9PROT|nr:glutathionylspermidine synthase family protein [Insolitispirillum peregrinum]SIS89710.1 Glutathionylspermidine synthase [Insolitispirillum peregrinum]